jgi:hypothetical protein
MLEQVGKFEIETQAKQRDIDVLIGIPSWNGGIEPDTQICLDKLFYHNVSSGTFIPIMKSTGSLIADNRNRIIEEAFRLKAKYVLLLDTDMLFPPSAIERMKAHGKPIVSGLAHSKAHPYAPNMYKFAEPSVWTPIVEWDDGELLKVGCVGGAFMLIELAAIAHLQKPYFAQPPVHDHYVWLAVKDAMQRAGDPTQAFKDAVALYADSRGLPLVLGEDYYFCDMLRRADIPIYVDTSIKLGHVGKWVFSYYEFDQARKAGYVDHLKVKKVS